MCREGWFQLFGFRKVRELREQVEVQRIVVNKLERLVGNLAGIVDDRERELRRVRLECDGHVRAVEFLLGELQGERV